MINSQVIGKVKLSTCAITFLPVRHEELGIRQDQNIAFPKAPIFNSVVIATGFLISPGVVLTNRHVVLEIVKTLFPEGVEEINPGNLNYAKLNHWYVRFTYPTADEGRWTDKAIRIKRLYTPLDPYGGGFLDFGLLGFEHQGSSEEPPYQPVEFGSLDYIEVGQDVALCGFPEGNKWLTNASGIFRSGAIVHQGIISAIAPYDNSEKRNITAFLTDMNSAPGMSGSPIFQPENGRVIGLHYAGLTGTIGASLPIDNVRVQGWLESYSDSFSNQSAASSVTNKLIELTLSGDAPKRS